MQKYQPRIRYPEMTGLRGLTALAVTFSHCANQFIADTQNYPNLSRVLLFLKKTPAFLFFSGHPSVVLYFCLCGFGLSKYFSETQQPVYFDFLKNRFTRVYIPYLLACTLAILLSQLIQISIYPELGPWIAEILTHPLSFDEILKHTFAIGNFRTNSLNPVNWSLVHEFRIYLLFPFVMIAIKGLSLMTSLALALISGISGVTLSLLWIKIAEKYGLPDINYFDTLTYMAMFIMGALLALNLDAVLNATKRLSKLNRSILGIVAVILFIESPLLPGKLNYYYDIPTSIGAIGIMITCLVSPKMSSLLRSRPIQFLGEISLSLYLIHSIVLVFMIQLLYPVVSLHWITFAAIASSLTLARISSLWHKREMGMTFLLAAVLLSASPRAFCGNYSPRGVGGGGAMSGLSISPHGNLLFVGTDMGTLFRSEDQGKKWEAISHAQVKFGGDLTLSSSVGFTANPKVVFFSESGGKPKRSVDAGITWQPISLTLRDKERILYWQGDLQDPKFILCATNQGLLISENSGDSWARSSGPDSPGTGSLIYRGTKDPKSKRLVLHATSKNILLSSDGGKSFSNWYTPPSTWIRSFAAGSDGTTLTAAFIDTHGEAACSWAKGKETIEDCGYVWVHSQSVGTQATFKSTKKEAGRHIKMAGNDPRTLYASAGNWEKQYGTKIWVSRDAGISWDLRMHLYNWDKRPYQVWPKEKLEYTAPGLDVGWHDNAYYSFAINPLNSSQTGTTGNFFLHMSRDFGQTWQAPFTKLESSGARAAQSNWSSVGLEVTSVCRLKFHPANPQLAYASYADIGGLVSEDGGKTWRISRTGHNTNYDYAFDPTQPSWAFAVGGDSHDYPIGQRDMRKSSGGVYLTQDKGRTWNRLTPKSGEWDRQFLSIGYDPIRKIIYAGTQGAGVARSMDLGKTWKFFNNGLSGKDLVIPQIEIDPKDGTAYALLTSYAPNFPNPERNGVYHLDPTSSDPSWKNLRGKVEKPKAVEGNFPNWFFPTSFAVDFSQPQRKTIWLSDMESNHAWLASGIWKTTDRGNIWNRAIQFTLATHLEINPKNPSHVLASGNYVVDGSWGQGGALSTKDGGLTWNKNTQMPLLSNLCGSRIDPNHPDKVFYLFFGGGMLYGPLISPQ
jgi:peptidoglycan/LPS O-acetylase OafA/YrhL/photosystem II stability/assembly factor-like uncharacterized protein